MYVSSALTICSQIFNVRLNCVILLQVLADHKTIVSYFHQFHPFGITAACLETFVKSCAGYCVIMYILGVGDRWVHIPTVSFLQPNIIGSDAILQWLAQFFS
jgi:hypothetical protein